MKEEEKKREKKLYRKKNVLKVVDFMLIKFNNFSDKNKNFNNI